MITIVESTPYIDAKVEALVNFVDCLGNPINENGVSIFNEYPEMYDKYSSWCKEGKIKPGMIWYFKGYHEKSILNFAILEDINSSIIEESTFRTGLSKLLDIVNSKNIYSFAIDTPNCISEIESYIDLYDFYFYKNEKINVEVYSSKDKIELITDIATTPLIIDKKEDINPNLEVTSSNYDKDIPFEKLNTSELVKTKSINNINTKNTITINNTNITHRTFPENTCFHI